METQSTDYISMNLRSKETMEKSILEHVSICNKIQLSKLCFRWAIILISIFLQRHFCKFIFHLIHRIWYHLATLITLKKIKYKHFSFVSGLNEKSPENLRIIDNIICHPSYIKDHRLPKKIELHGEENLLIFLFFRHPARVSPTC